MTRTTAHRQQAQRHGRRSEGIAAWWLRLKGYRILERDLRCPVGEIDLIARRGNTLAIVEVKARADMAEAAEAISGRQRRRILAALGWYLQRRPEFAEARIRFDAVLIAPNRLPQHLAGCWEPPATG
jgi:putative endonuclease